MTAPKKDYQLSVKNASEAELAEANATNPLAANKKNVAAIDSTAVALVDRESGVLTRLFPSATERAKAASKLQMIKTETEFRERVLIMFRDTQMQTMREAYDVYLKQLKVEGRGNIATHIAKKLTELESAISTECDRMISLLEERYDKLDKIKVPEIKTREKARLDEVLDGFYTTTRKLTDDFRNIVHEDVKGG